MLHPFPNLSRECPITALPDLMYVAAFHVGDVTGAPVEALVTDVIAAANTPLQIIYDVVGPDGREMPMSINTTCLVPSGVGKSESFKLFFSPFQGDEKAQMLQELATGVVADDEGLLLSTISIPSLLDRIHGVGQGIAIQDTEGFRFLDEMLVARDIFAKLYSGETIKRKNRKANCNAVDARSNIGFRHQPELMYDYLRITRNLSYFQGLWPRSLAACHDPTRFPNPPAYMPAPTSALNFEDFLDVLKMALEMVKLRKLAGITDRKKVWLDMEAAAFMRHLKYKLHQPGSGWIDTCYSDIRQSAQRAWEQTLRLAALFDLVCVRKGKIGLEMVERAWRIVEWSLTQHRLIFVEGLRPEPKMPVAHARVPSWEAAQPKPPKPLKAPRPIQDAQWFLECFDRLRGFGSQAPLHEVATLANLSGRRLESVRMWIKLENAAEIVGRGENVVVRVPRLLPHSNDPIKGLGRL